MQTNQEDKILISKALDKIEMSKIKNKIANTEFLNEYQISVIKKELNKIKAKNYCFAGGYEDAESKIFIAYPDKFDENVIEENINQILKAIKIELPSQIYGKLEHRDYLGTVMSFGLERNRIGDIIVYRDSAYIIVLNENAQYIKSSFEYENKFKKAKISIIDIKDLKTKKAEFIDIQVRVNSVRLDSIISELLHTSRKKAQELLEDEKVSINYTIETKPTKVIKENDILIIRGNGKYIIQNFLGKNKKEKEIITIKKYK